MLGSPPGQAQAGRVVDQAAQRVCDVRRCGRGVAGMEKGELGFAHEGVLLSEAEVPGGSGDRAGGQAPQHLQLLP